MPTIGKLRESDDKLGYSTFELCAPGMVNYVELVAMTNTAIGHSIEVGEPAFYERAQAVHIPNNPTQQGLRAMYTDYHQYGFPGGNALVLRTILEREPRTIRQYIQELAARNRQSHFIRLTASRNPTEDKCHQA